MDDGRPVEYRQSHLTAIPHGKVIHDGDDPVDGAVPVDDIAGQGIQLVRQIILLIRMLFHVPQALQPGQDTVDCGGGHVQRPPISPGWRSFRPISLMYSITEKIFCMESSLLFIFHRRPYSPKFSSALWTSSVKVLHMFS